MAATVEDRLTRLWERRPDLLGLLGTVDHKEIGLRYMVTAFTFFGLAGIVALLMRTQLASPENTLLSPGVYNQLFTMHGTTMIFLFATPIQSGFGNYLLPLMIGARDMAFPRLNAFGYWVFLLAGLCLYSSFFLGGAPASGWFSYAPLTETAFSPGLGQDFWAIGLIFLGISTTSGAINFIVTILRLRAPGMSVSLMPLFAWAVLATSFAIIFALPPLTAAAAMIELDRRLGMHFFGSAGGGNPLLWQHLFWIFGHPDVYIILLPAVGMVSMIVPVFARRPLVGYSLVALATMATALISFGVWVHHMFAVGLAFVAMSFFSAASVIITVPSGIQVFAWLTTLWTGRPVWKPPLLFVTGFLLIFVLGGLTGVMFPMAPFDWQVHDSYFVVAHFHYVLIGGAVFPIFAGFHYWLPKMTGRLLDDKLGRVTFWLMFLGFNLAFFPMHLLGLMGMPRRVYTYAVGLGWESLNLLATVGAYLLGVGILVFIWNVLRSLAAGEPATGNVWSAATLEWSVSSPPPAYNFRTIPAVRGRDPLWEGAGALELPGEAEHRQTPSTTELDGDLVRFLSMPSDSLWPLALALALAVLVAGLLAGQLWLIAIGAVAAVVGIVGWLWPGGAS